MDFTSLNNFVDHIYIITLERDIERQENIKKCLDGANYSFFFGIDRKNLVMDELIANGVYDEAKAIAHHRFDKPMNTGQIGTSWSHRLVYEDMLAKGYEKVLILEDDVSPCKEGVELIAATLANLPPDWELVYFDTDKNLSRNFGTWIRQVGYHIRSFFGRMKWSHSVIKNIYARKYADNILIAGMHDSSNAYAITRSAATKLRTLQTPICFLAGDLLAHASTNKMVNAYVYQPNAFQKDLKLLAKTLID
jgi:glycosyl transferase family 25